jgi:hypothetical protein
VSIPAERAATAHDTRSIEVDSSRSNVAPSLALREDHRWISLEGTCNAQNSGEWLPTHPNALIHAVKRTIMSRDRLEADLHVG